ncbi:adenylate/guanylate cyclase domain-containing protein [uncultured Tateyamaria sp.]|uniref:adenylate/guanylate cyclase domain-containing protein n=1 Tax=uncultured Tateyamaria sp. TaxID=455651 RepID=UPI00260CF025|nr:adenylate/guanylate cyclase domain-containing protein [uncultured Tateyamaria sp.]
MSIERAILLADVSGSTPLYQRYGDAEASRMVFECVEGMQRIATETGGEFVRSKGDDVLCLFESADQAMAAARGILEQGARGEVSVHAGLHWGTVLWRGEELFGNAVNVAARLGGQAKENEVLMSRELVEHASASETSDLRSMGEITLRGTDAPTEVFAMLAEIEDDEDGVTSFMSQSTVFTARQREHVANTTLRLSFEDWAQDIPEGRELKIGRSTQCDLVMSYAWVSRVHAAISVRGGIVEFKDSSSAGCTLTIGAHPEFFIRRQTVALTGSGVIELGSNAAGDNRPRINFEVTG